MPRWERDHAPGSQIYSLFPRSRQGGTVTDAGQVMLDSGLMNPDLLKVGSDKEAQRAWRRTRIRDRAQAIIAHEMAEYEDGADHELALIAGLETKLPISHEARELLKKKATRYAGASDNYFKPYEERVSANPA